MHPNKEAEMDGESREVVVTVGDEDREAEFRKGEGIVVPGDDIQQDELILVNGKRLKVSRVQRTIRNGIVYSIILETAARNEYRQ